MSWALWCNGHVFSWAMVGWKTSFVGVRCPCKGRRSWNRDTGLDNVEMAPCTFAARVCCHTCIAMLAVTWPTLVNVFFSCMMGRRGCLCFLVCVFTFFSWNWWRPCLTSHPSQAYVSRFFGVKSRSTQPAHTNAIGLAAFRLCSICISVQPCSLFSCPRRIRHASHTI